MRQRLSVNSLRIASIITVLAMFFSACHRSEVQQVGETQSREQVPAVAKEQEMRVKTQEMNAIKIAAEAEVPKAMAKAFEEGKIGVMDYYKMQNVVADTKMRNSLAGSNGDNKK